jgi:TonB family protein
MGDMQIPAVRTTLEEAAAMRTRTPEVYLALANIYFEEVRRFEEALRLKKQDAIPPVERPVSQAARSEPAANWKSYMAGSVPNIDYDLLADSENRPRVAHVVAPYYPPELITQKIPGEVVLDVQVNEEGTVGGIWLISAMPDIFGTLATASVREWQFEKSIPAKIRVVLRFTP